MQCNQFCQSAVSKTLSAQRVDPQALARSVEAAEGLEADHFIPVGNVHVSASELTGKQHSIVRDEVPHFFQLIHSLLQPML
jgi:hypothetical protein